MGRSATKHTPNKSTMNVMNVYSEQIQSQEGGNKRCSRNMMPVIVVKMDPERCETDNKGGSPTTRNGMKQ